ncbi:MAG TPA: hypothetical protein VJ888_04950 [Mobilitalea sp.]|nr:hypothetical protein [Mobilitalea sp.]
MFEIDGKWIMEGLGSEDSRRIRTSKQLSEYINHIGFLPLFKNNIPGFSVEELTTADSWFSGRQGEDPWGWREVVAGEREIAYGKLFCNRAGFISREWYPYFASYRRDGYDFDSRYEDGLASRKHKKLMDVLELYDSMPSNVLKAQAGFGKGGEKGFDGATCSLQMQTYIVVNGFHKRRNKNNEEYGWSVADYTLSERLFGEEHVKSAYGIGASEAKSRIVGHLLKHITNSTYRDVEKLIK